MKNKILKLDSACDEKWENMQPNETGSYCDLCSKTVIDFTILNQVEIAKIIQNSGNSICARLTQSQLEVPLLYADKQYGFYFPKSKVVAAGLLLASSLTIGQTMHVEKQNMQPEFIQSADSIAQTVKEKPQTTPIKQKLDDTIVFKGKVMSEDLKKPVENAKITFVSTQKLLMTYSAKDGTFSIEIPKDLIDNDNVIRVSYYDVKEDRKDKLFGYKEEDHILTREEIKTSYNIKAATQRFFLGGISTTSKVLKPIVLSNGKTIKYRQFVKAQIGQKSSCSLENKKYLYFAPKYAMAIYGKKAKDGLYILIDKFEK